MEVDVFISDILLGIEYDGLHWHKTEKEHIREKKKYAYAKITKFI